ncbi:MAG: hypothetical protein FJ302_18930 [Planctomycetes bacterium]|nr:hypothetical protein [Planctomycetota bacterium]
MTVGPLVPPSTDPTSIFEFFRGSYGTELLTAAVVEFDLFRRLIGQPKPFDELRTEIGLQRRPAVVLCTALRAMGLLTTDSRERLWAVESDRSLSNQSSRELDSTPKRIK